MDLPLELLAAPRGSEHTSFYDRFGGADSVRECVTLGFWLGLGAAVTLFTLGLACGVVP